MAILTAAQATRLDKSNPEFERSTPFADLKETQAYAPVVITYEVAADSTGAPTAFTAPFAMQILDIIVQCKATVGGGTITPQKGSDAMCTAIACATDGAVTRMSAGVTTPARLVLASGDLVKVDAANAGDRGLVTFIGKRL